MRGLSAKNVIVTGGGGAIGGAICRRFAGYGASVGVFDKNLDGADKVAAFIGDVGERSWKIIWASVDEYEKIHSQEHPVRVWERGELEAKTAV